MPTYEETEAANVFEAVGINIQTRAELRTAMEKQLARRWGSGTGGKWQEGLCKICGTPLMAARTTTNILGHEMTFMLGCCEGCTVLRDKHYDRSNLDRLPAASKTPDWDENCPELYKELIAQLPPSVDKVTFERVTAWRPAKGGRGMILTGDSGSGKTTSLWALFRGLEIAESRPVFLTAVELQRQLSEAARDIKDVKHLTHARVLMVDDLGKEKLTASVAALLWEVIDSRYANRRPTIISTRYAGKKFEERFGDAVLGIDIRRRLLDCADILQFKDATGGNGGTQEEGRQA